MWIGTAIVKSDKPTHGIQWPVFGFRFPLNESNALRLSLTTLIRFSVDQWQILIEDFNNVSF